MKEILVPQPPMEDNTYLANLDAALQRLGYRFRYCPLDEDPAVGPLGWIQWPEALCGWRPPEAEAWERIDGWLAGMKRCGGRLLWTVHNLRPHRWPDHPDAARLYRLVASAAQVQVHHGAASVGLVAEAYPEAAGVETVVYPLPGYENLVGALTREEARRELGWPADARVLLAVGALRNVAEERLLERAAFARRWRVGRVGALAVPWARKYSPRWLRRRLLLARLLNWVGFVRDESMDIYLKACDAVLIARVEILNSANVPLAFSFGRAAIGPDRGNVGPLLRETGNFVFDPNSGRDVRRALRAAADADLDALGEANRRWLETNATWDGLAKAAVEKLETAHA